MINKTKPYYPGLTGIRGIAVLMVVFAHVASFKYTLQPLKPKVTSVGEVGVYGVIMFFVLSGFLITKLLLTEKADTGKINLFNFFIRRSLRIIPLYYVFIIFSYLLELLLHQPSSAVLYLTMFLFISNYADSFMNLSYYIHSHSWSISVEEQFYLLWPFAIRLKKHVVLALVVLIVYFISKLYLYYFNAENKWLFFLLKNAYPSLLVGAAVAFLKKSYVDKYLNFLAKSWAQFLLGGVVFFIAFVYSLPISTVFKSELFALLCALIVVSVAFFNSFSGFLEHKILIFLGTISYGMYLFQNPIAYLVTTYLNRLFPIDINKYVLFSAELFTTIACSIAVAYIMHIVVEKPFLRLKAKFN